MTKETIKTTNKEATRPARRKVYERVREAQIPSDVMAKFAKDGYDIKLVRWAIRNEPDYRYLNRREQEGYEFVTKDELPESYLRTMRLRDTGISKGLVTNGGDLCLMKIDSELRKSRQEYYDDVAKEELNAVDINVTGKRKGLINTGSRSKTIMREPSFDN